MTRTNALIALAGIASLAACKNGQEQASSTPLPDRPATASSTTSARPAGPAPETAKAPTEASASPGSANQTFNFDSDRADAVPAGFSFGRTGSGPPGRWIVRAEPDAPSRPHVLAQLDADDTDFRFPIAVADAPSLRDARSSVRCKMVSGRVDQACGLVFRYQDENNYFITRANALENNIRFYTVKDGKRRQLASWSGRVAASAWHEYVVEVRGDHVQIFWNGAKVLDHRDASFPDAGRVGVWTKADSVTYYDDLRVEGL